MSYVVCDLCITYSENTNPQKMKSYVLELLSLIPFPFQNMAANFKTGDIVWVNLGHSYGHWPAGL